MRPLLLLTALLVACGHAAPRPRPAAAASFNDRPELVACRATPGACHAAAWRALRGEGELTGDWVAAAFLMAGCEGGHAASCGDLASLYAAGRGVPLDHGRACELGRSESCAKAGRSPPFAPGAATGPLPPPGPAPAPARPDPADVEGFARLAWSLYPELQAPLSLTREALAATPPAPPAERALVNLVVARRTAAVQACIPAGVTSDPNRKVNAVASFTAGPDGHPGAVAVRVGLPAPAAASAEWARCAEGIVAGWALPLTPSGGRFWLTFRGAGEPIAQPAADGWPAYPTAGYTAPVAQDPSCVADHLHLPYRELGYSGGAVAQFAVLPGGGKAWFSVSSADGVPAGVVEATWKAVQRCAWSDGLDPQGRPAAVWVVLPLRFSRGE